MIDPIQLKEVFQSFPDNCLLLKPSSRGFIIVEANRFFKNNIASRTGEFLGMEIMEVIRNDKTGVVFATQLVSSLQKVLSTGNPDHIPEIRYDLPALEDSSLIQKIWEIDNIPIKDALGEIEFILHRIRDITPLVKVKEKEQASLKHLQQNEKLLKETQEVALIGSWELNLETNTLFWSHILRKIHEVPENFTPNLDTAIDFYKGERHKDIIRKAVSKAIETGEGFDLELEIVTATNKDKWIRATGKAEFKNGKCIRVYGATQDITSRKLAETRLEHINDNIPGVVFRFKMKANGEDELMYVSEGAQEIWGVQPIEAAQNNNKIWDLYHPDDIESHRESIHKSAQELSLWTHEWRIIHPEKGIRWNRGFGSPQKFSDGSVVWDSIVLDITEEKLAYELLELNESRQRSLLESQTSYVIRTDLEGKYTYYNKKFQEDFGWIHSETALIGENCLIAVIEEDRVKVEETALKCIENPNTIFQIEIGKPKRNGDIRSTVWDFIALSDTNGYPTEIQCVGIDISEKKEAEIALSKAKEQYEGLIQSIEGIFWELDVESFQFTFVSHQAKHLLGIKPKDWYHDPKFWENHIHPEDRDYAVNFCLNQVKKENNHSFEYRMKKADGSFIWVSDMVSVVKKNGKPRWLRGVMTDITKRKYAEEQIQLSEKRFKGLVQEGGDLIAVMNEKGDYIYASPTSTAVLGFTPDDFANRNAFDFIHPEDLEKVKSKFETVLKNKRLEIKPFRFKHKNGGWRWLETTVTEMLDDKAVRGIVCNSRDITDKKRYQDLENLERKVLEMNFKEGALLINILNFYLENLEAINPNAYFVIQKLENEKLYNWASGAIPSSLSEAIDNRSINTDSDLCSLVKNNKPLISKINEAANSNLKSRAQENSIDSCWSYPLIDLNGNTMAILTAFYKNNPQIEEAREEKNISRAVGLLQLIIEFQFNEIALKRSNQRYKFVNKATNDALYDWDVIKDDIEWGDGFYKMFNLVKEEGNFSLSKLSTRIHPQDVDWVIEDLKKTLKDQYTNKWDAKYRFQTSGGDYLNIMGNGYIIRDEAGKAVRMIGVLRDLTKLRVYEKELEEANERYRYATKATSDAIWDYNVTEDSVFWGAGFEFIFGHRPKDLAPNLSTWFKNIHPEDLKRINKSFEKALNDGSEMWEEEYRYRNRQGEYLDVFDRGFVVRDKEGKAIRMVGAMQDITRKKQYENSLEKLNSDLTKRAKELAISNAELEQFAYVASHDLQEPLRMVTSFLTQLEKKYGNILDEKALLYIDFAVDGAKRMRQIILDLLEFSRVGRTEDKLEEVDLNEILDDIQHLYRKKISDKNVKITAQNLPVIKTTKSPIRQVFQNLISNAIKYSKAGIAPQIQIKFKETKDFWEFSVKDNGIGIEQEYFDRIFVIFQRLHRREEYSGTGMGLAVTKKIIENLGGKIWLESKEEEGSEFYFTIAKNIAKT